ncbi:MAG: hypothetical protein USCAAHI_00074 [Beijerinckiaceae bacterium]|nr:MAG: hypothetical protein USCAAHI_00074 [Beijerinckiaceae bacterium]
MPKTFFDLNSATLAELLSDPIVQMLMRADHVTEQQLMSLISDTLSKLTGIEQLPDLIVPFKRHVYLSVLNEFCAPAGPL